MTTTATAPPPTSGSRADAGAGASAGGSEVSRELHVAAVLDTMVACRRTADQQEANLLALAVEYVTLHPATDLLTDPTHAEDPDGLGDREDPSDGPPAPVGVVRATLGQEGLRPDTWCPLAGPGTPAVPVEAVAALAAALGLTQHAAMSLVADALELAHRLPRLWALVHDGHLPAWRARHVTAHTPTLTAATVEFLDRHLAAQATRGHLPGPGQLRALVHEALLACDPEVAAGREDAALHDRDVTFHHHHCTATTALTATLDTLDALDLDATLTDLAATMARLGDTDPLGVRRAHALGTLAHPQRTLDLYGDPRPQPALADTVPDHTSSASAGASKAVAAGASAPSDRVPWNATTATLYLHITTDDLRSHTEVSDDGDPAACRAGGAGMVERLGPATLELLREWLHRSDKLTVRPVLDINAARAVDRHDPPDAIRQAVILRDGHCVFPACTTDARSCDLDHITPYLPLDQGGPPGQTSPDNLAALCRRHHRIKTLTAWTYNRTPAGDYAWTSPTGRTYLTRSQPTTPPRRC